MTLVGMGWGTGPQQVVWFCHVCNWSGVLSAGVAHQCKVHKR